MRMTVDFAVQLFTLNVWQILWYIIFYNYIRFILFEKNKLAKWERQRIKIRKRIRWRLYILKNVSFIEELNFPSFIPLHLWTIIILSFGLMYENNVLLLLPFLFSGIQCFLFTFWIHIYLFIYVILRPLVPFI